MLRLQQTFGAHAGRSRELDQDVVRFGRLPTNDFAFDPHADLDASGNHAEIRKENGRFVLVDVGSRNGTLVDGKPVQRCVLEGGEEIEFGTGGPRVRIEIVGSVTTGRGAPTAPATPMTPLDAAHAADGPVSAQGPTAFAPALGIVTPPWPA
ncbi:MAG: FHA domain-containing protein, partial [Myxococcota bacterium]|nr:FHA domain-containing protein [Myxococcota bacterium]